MPNILEVVTVVKIRFVTRGISFEKLQKELHGRDFLKNL